MPLDLYFKGQGESVMEDMVRRYGPNKGKSVFYATANSHKGMKPASERPKHGPKINPMRSIK